MNGNVISGDRSLRLLFAATVAVSVLVLLALVGGVGFAGSSVSAAQYQYGPFESAVGGGSRTGPPFAPRHFAFSAHDTPRGVVGHFEMSSPTAVLLNFSARVRCLHVVGNRAIVGGVMTRAQDPAAEGRGFAMAFEDNGPPREGEPQDRASLTDVFLEPGRPPPMTDADCAAVAGLFATLAPMSSGNVVIRDASAS